MKIVGPRDGYVNNESYQEISKEDRERLRKAKVAFLEGNRFLQTGFYEEAISSYGKALNFTYDISSLRLGPPKVELESLLHSDRAVCYSNLGMFEETITASSRALELNHSNADALLTRGQMYEKFHHLEEALADMKRVIELNPLNYKVRRAVEHLEWQIEERQTHTYDRGIAVEIPDVVTDEGSQGPPASHLNHDIESGHAMRRNYYMPLHLAAVAGDWDKATEFLRNDPDALDVPIATHRRTVLHIAAGANQFQFVMEVLARVSARTLEMRDSFNGNTVLHYIASSGCSEAVKEIVKKNDKLTKMKNNQGWTPLVTSTAFVTENSEEIIRFLCDVAKLVEPSTFEGHLGVQIICNIARVGLLDLTHDLLRQYPTLATSQDATGCCVLEILAMSDSLLCDEATSGFLSRLFPVFRLLSKKSRSNRFRRLLKFVTARISLLNGKQMVEFFTTSKVLQYCITNGKIEIMRECLLVCPDLLWAKINRKSLIAVAIENRQKEIVVLLNQKMKTDTKMLLASEEFDEKNNILHLTAKLPPSHRLNISPCAALQMREELMWFREMQNFVPPTFLESRNVHGHTPEEVFRMEHERLLVRAEEWTLRTASSCMVIATLVASGVYSGVYQVLGGASNGIPLFLHRTAFKGFSVSDLFSFLSSIGSLLIFVSILTSRFVESDFWLTLPTRLSLAFTSLWVSLANMLASYLFALAVREGDPHYSVYVTLFFCLLCWFFGLSHFRWYFKMYRRPSLGLK